MANVTIVPEVYSGIVTERVNGNIKISTLADDYGILENSKEGNSITFPMFKALSDAELLTKGTAITVEELSQTSSKKTVFHPAKGVEIYDEDSISALGQWVEQGMTQQARVIAKIIDDKMVEDIDANVILKTATANAKVITDDEIMAGFQLFGDAQDNEDFAGIVVHSLLAPSFYKMDSFIKKDVTTSAEYNGQIINGCIGYYRGTIPVLLSDINTYDSVKAECKSYIIKKQALGIMKKRDILVEPERDASKKKTNIYTDTFVACGLVMKDGVCVLRKTII